MTVSTAAIPGASTREVPMPAFVSREEGLSALRRLAARVDAFSSEQLAKDDAVDAAISRGDVESLSGVEAAALIRRR